MSDDGTITLHPVNEDRELSAISHISQILLTLSTPERERTIRYLADRHRVEEPF